MDNRIRPDWTSDESQSEDAREKEKEALNKLATQVEEQCHLRLQDAKLVEAKAARIKEWVTNKLRELEAQNQHLREQNHKCNQQLELLRRHMAQLSSNRNSPCVTEFSSPKRSSILRANSTGSSKGLLDCDQIYAEVDRQSKGRPSHTHRRHLSACVSTDGLTSACSLMSHDLQQAVDNLALLPVHIRPKSEGIESDIGHDYAEIYTPSREKLMWDDTDLKPPTPPLHRFPSWESRIYQVANEGLSVASGNEEDDVNRTVTSSQGYCDINVPVYTIVKGRASQIRSMPFTGESSDDSSDGEVEHPFHTNVAVCVRNQSSSDNTDSSISSTSPSKSHKTISDSVSPARRSSSGSPTKDNMSFESEMSEDYAIPPDALSCSGDSLEWYSLVLKNSNYANVGSPCRLQKGIPPSDISIDKSGYLVKLGGKLKTWRRRWFQLNNGKLHYWKSQNDIKRKPQGEILMDQLCRITRADGAATFEIATTKKTYYLTADSIATMEEWLRILQNAQRRNATKLLLNKDKNKPDIEGWLTKVRNGHSKKCWCVLVGKMFLYFKSPSDNTPLGQINMKDARVEEVEQISDSDSEEKEADSDKLTIGIFPSQSPPTYLLMSTKQEKDSWMYHLTIVSRAGANEGTQYEQLVQKLMDTEGDPNCILWRHPLMLYSKDPLTAPLTTLTSESLQNEAIKLFKSVQLFTAVAVESAGIDYHVVLAQNALQQCLDYPELQDELICILVKQTSKHVLHKHGVQQLLLCATQSLFTCDATGTESPTVAIPPSQIPSVPDSKSNPSPSVFIQGWQLLALAVSLFLPRNKKLLWYLKLHLQRNADTKTECGKYAAYCERALERTIKNGGREVKPSRMEVLSILLKNPYHHSLPHSIPVHLLNGAYQVTGFDGSTTIEEFLQTLNSEIDCRDSNVSGFALFSDDPIDKNLEHYLEPELKLCDVISKWETALREKGTGKFENNRCVQFIYKNRLYFRSLSKKETDRERLLLCYQTNQQVVLGRFPLTKELALELAALLSQIDHGELENDKSGAGSKELLILQALDRFYPYKYRDSLTQEELTELQGKLQEKWLSLKGRTVLDCVRIYLNCTKKWPYFGASLFQAKFKTGEGNVVWLAVAEDAVSLLELGTMKTLSRFMYSNILTFGGSQDDFMLVYSTADHSTSQKLLFVLSKAKILEVTLLIADYMNAFGHGGTPCGTLTRSIQSPDLLKCTTSDQQGLSRTDTLKYKSNFLDATL
ncbi:hypothetical protein M8J77_023476 [Diaphorina citri]|nr:hypothetical protein M8J77_023476 [Diaphorina citri]